MLIVRIELHSAVTGEIKTLATGKIVNTGTGSPTRGNYRIELRDAAGRVWKTGQIADFPRKRLLAWDLMYCALKKLVGSRNPALDSPVLCGFYGEEQTTPTNTRGTNNDRPTPESERHPKAP